MKNIIRLTKLKNLFQFVILKIYSTIQDFKNCYSNDIFKNSVLVDDFKNSVLVDDFENSVSVHNFENSV